MPLLLALLALLVATPPAPSRWVEDHAACISPETRASLDARLESYERATGHQVIVWIDKSLDGQPLDDWAVRTFAAWKVGRKEADDGIAMFIFADDRAIDIEVGYGLEDKVPDATASRIIHDVMTPKLQAGDRDGAVTAGTDAILAAIEGKPWQGSTAPPPATTSHVPWIGGIVFVVMIIILIINPRAAGSILWALFWMGRGGGFGGGGGGGGFGGGGGSSGGGGARGKW